MADVEAQIRAWAEIEAANASPLPTAAAVVERSGLGGERRVDRRRAWVAAAVVLVAIALIGVAALVRPDDDGGAGDVAATPTAGDTGLPVQAVDGTELGFDFLDDFVEFADAVVVGSFTQFTEQAGSSGPDVDDPNGSTTRYGALELEVDQVLKGDDVVEAGEAIEVRCADVILDAAGEPIASVAPYVAGLDSWEDLVGTGQYLVFLNEVSDELWAVSSSQGLLTIDDDVVYQLPAPRAPRTNYTSDLEGRPLEDVLTLIRQG